MPTVRITASNPYDVVIERGIRKELAPRLAAMFPGSRVCFVSDDNVASLHLSPLEAQLNAASIQSDRFVFPHGEASKSPDVLFSLLEFLAKKRFSRKDVLVALGGGVTGDLTGLASALYMRGMRLVQMPTTLLSMVDSSVGGKTAVNLKSGKNLCGVFRQPDLVLCDPEMLETLPDTDFADGMAEVVKYGVIADADLFSRVENGCSRDSIEAIVTRCVELKRDVVAEDEFDRGKRALLNFGHTPAHAIEAESDFSVSHGRAVAMGMVIMARIAEEFGYAAAPSAERIEQALKNNRLPTVCPYANDQLFNAATADKKRDGDHISLVFPKCIGNCFVESVSIPRLKELFHA